MTETTGVRRVTIAGQRFALRRQDVVRALRTVDPEPISSHFVVIDDRRFPPKQVISTVTGLDRADFTTHQARRTLVRLGFAAGRRGSGQVGNSQRLEDAPSPAERWRPLAGRWVATRGDDVLYAANTPQEVVAWLARHGQRADSMFRVPGDDDRAVTGLAPL